MNIPLWMRRIWTRWTDLSIAIRLYLILLSLPGLSCVLEVPILWTLVLHGCVLGLCASSYQAGMCKATQELTSYVGSLPVFFREEYHVGLVPYTSPLVQGLLQQRVLTRENLCRIPLLPSPILDSLYSPDRQRQMASSAFLAEVFQTPLGLCIPSMMSYERILKPMQFATHGTLYAIQVAYESKTTRWSLQLGGGYTQASRTQSLHGCVYPDISVGILSLKSKYPLLKRICIVDLTARQGQGYAEDKLANLFQPLLVTIVDMYIPLGTPKALNMIDYPVKLQPSLTDTDYLQLLDDQLQRVFESVLRPELVIYIAGADLLEYKASCEWDVPLRSFHMAEQTLLRRDQLVFQRSRDHHVPIAMIIPEGRSAFQDQVMVKSILNLKHAFHLWT